MTGTSLSVIIPVFNEAEHLPETIEALVTAVDESGFDAELIIVDDGSTDGSADVAGTAVAGRMPFRVLAQPNIGRFEARRAGLAAAAGDTVLLLDARASLHPDALRFVHARVEAGELLWNGHVHVETESALGMFWRLLAELAWHDYFGNPRTTSFGAEEFDRFPKGTGCFLAPRALLASAFQRFRSRYADIRLANDDTPILRDLAARVRIGISPSFACEYTPRTTLARFFRHSIHRGAVFLDGHGTRSSRFFPAAVAFFPVSAGIVLLALRRPWIVPVVLAACGVAPAAYGVRAGRTGREIWTLLTVTPVYAVGHGLGMWRGLGEIIRGRLGR